jgi:hypothetical protein
VTGQDRQGKAPFSIRASVEFKTHVRKMAKDLRISQAAYLQTLITRASGRAAPVNRILRCPKSWQKSIKQSSHAGTDAGPAITEGLMIKQSSMNSSG